MNDTISYSKFEEILIEYKLFGVNMDCLDEYIERKLKYIKAK